MILPAEKQYNIDYYEDPRTSDIADRAIVDEGNGLQIVVQLAKNPTCDGCYSYSLHNILTGAQFVLLPPLEVDDPLRKADQIVDLLFNARYGFLSYEIANKSIDGSRFSPLRTMTIDVVLK